jgi:hypothetical protein
MPFTLSHPAAVLPLRRALPFAALAIGSMAPDFPYFIGLGEARFRTHTFVSIATFSVPVGLAVYLAFERWLRAAWCDLLPAALAARALRAAPPASLLAACAALAFGAFTHVAWDSFTHEHEPGVALVNALNTVIVRLLGFPVRGYTLLQHGSTLVGLALLAFALREWLRRTPQRALPESWQRVDLVRACAPWYVGGMLAPAALVIGLYLFPPWVANIEWISFVGAAVVSGMSLTLASLLAYAVWWWRCAAEGVLSGARRARSW